MKAPSARLDGMAGIGVDRMGRSAAAASPQTLRLENLDTNLPLPDGVYAATKTAVAGREYNSYLPFFGRDELRERIGQHCNRRSGQDRLWEESIVLCAGGLNGILNSLLAIIEPGDEVIVQDPIYIGLLNRIKLAGGKPVFLPYQVSEDGFRIDADSVSQCVSARTKAFLIMSPAMPSGMVLHRDDWQAICKACVTADAWMLYNSAMETYLFDDLEYVHPSTFPGMPERTITVGSFSKEFRMIGWRIGWIDAPKDLVEAVGLVNISNVVCNVGFSQAGCMVALDEQEERQRALAAELQDRRDLLLDELRDLGAICPQGGWSMLIDTAGSAETATSLSNVLLEVSEIAATPVTGWGSDATDRYLRLVFSNESKERLKGIRSKFHKAISRLK